MSVDLVRVYEKLSDLIKKQRFKKGRIRLIVDSVTTQLEKRETIIEGIWNGWVNTPPGIFLKEAEMYDLVQQYVKGYTVEGRTPEYSRTAKRKNVRKKGSMFISAHSILFIELTPEDQ